MMRPKFDPSQPSLINNEADFPILTPIVTPRDRNEEVFLLVIISSAPRGVSIERRRTIRKTWGKIDPKSERKHLILFMTGKTGEDKADEKLFEESKMFGDLLICDYTDHYSKIINKLLASFNWAWSVQEKYKFQYVLKSDDDVYVNIPRLLQWIDAAGSKMENVYAGITYSGIVVRDKKHRHYVSKEAVPYDYYPVFCKGSTFLLSKTLVVKIVDLSKKIQRIIPDDAYIGLIMNELRVKPTKINGLIHHPLFRFILKITGLCFFRNAVGVGDSLSTEQIRGLHQHATETHGSISGCVTYWFEALIVILVLVIIYYSRYQHRMKYSSTGTRVHPHQ